jgi:transposase
MIHPIPRSTLAQWVGSCGVQLQPLVDAMRAELLQQRVLHADETPVAMLGPGAGKTKRADLWTYCSTALQSTKLVVFDFAESRAGRHAAEFLAHPGELAWRGTLVCDDYSGYKALLETARPIADALRAWLTAQRQKVPPGSATTRAIDYTLGRWAALTRYIDDGDLPADNNWVENQIRPIAIGRSNWLFAGSFPAGKRAAAVMSLIQSARMNGHDPYAYLSDVLTRLPTQRASQVGALLPHRWAPAS